MNVDETKVMDAYYNCAADMKELCDGMLFQQRDGIWRQFRSDAHGGSWCAVGDDEAVPLMREFLRLHTPIENRIKALGIETAPIGTQASPSLQTAHEEASAPSTPSTHDSVSADTRSVGELLTSPAARALFASLAKPTAKASWDLIVARHSGASLISPNNVSPTWRIAVERATARIEAERSGKSADPHGWAKSADRVMGAAA